MGQAPAGTTPGSTAAAPGHTGADLLCETLLAHGVDHCFANPGTSEMHFVAALDRQPGMRCVLGLSEGVVAGAADGYARMADKPASTLFHTGPGLANAGANLHNARRARTPMVNVVGDHAAWHLHADAPLTSDIESLARPVSDWVHRIASADAIGDDTARAVREARAAPGRVATLILPADHAWGPTRGQVPPLLPAVAPAAPDVALVGRLADALRQRGPHGGTVLLLAGRALRDEGLGYAARIAAATGCRLLTQQANARVQRGLGRLKLDRVAYVVDVALKRLSDIQRLVLVGAKAPVGFFGYPDRPSSMLPAGCDVVTLTTPQQDGVAALRELAAAVDPHGTADTSGLVAQRQDLPGPATGTLTASAISRSVVALMPEQAIICDESVSNGRDFFPGSWHAAPHDYLQLTGGAIGLGIPLATGAAIAAPGRKVIGLQADGSAMYTLQGLWTQARERLDVVTIVYANRGYAILHGELTAVGAGAPGRNARRMLDIDDPALDFVQLARGMGVAAERADTAERFHDLLAAAVRTPGPMVIEAVI
ncbi:MAG: acetolactate synthase large subunit [Aquabacterium sp.]